MIQFAVSRFDGFDFIHIDDCDTLPKALDLCKKTAKRYKSPPIANFVIDVADFTKLSVERMCTVQIDGPISTIQPYPSKEEQQ